MIIYQPSDGYCYNSDTIFLYDFIRRFYLKGSCLDIGSGSGVLGLLIARNFDVKLTAVEKQEKMAFFSKKNAEVNNIDIDLMVGDFLEMDLKKSFDFIISNPPFYHPDVIQSEKTEINISRYSHHLPLDKLFKKVASLLKPKGYFIFCYDAKQLQDIVYHLSLNRLRIEALRFVHPKRSRDATLVMMKCRKNSKSFAKIIPPLYVFEDEKFSDEAQKIFKEAGVHSIKCLI
ncbi:tRNA1(Val) (adenine(37)-N6)-methyltransferase [Nitrosophilus alvini]|uniref:tRNA1(Val) (adenine(37)-N6)-methyltransferase n=1 Tax=Nitrosophilus alvini TaxID=2714855 RepID=UPI0022789692|nr:methyltransferase [Nitrosophilus alvini]